MESPGAEFLSGGGEMGERIRAFDWSQTPLGIPSSWPQSLKTAVGILLNSGYPMYLAWGPSFIQIYNDAYRPILGDTKHPAALGITTEETFSEIWGDIGPMFRNVIGEAKPSTFVDMMLPLNRYGFPEECYFVFSYSPVLLASGQAGGVFVTVLETTDRVLRERRQRVLKNIAGIHAQNTRDHIFRSAIDVISDHPEDVPFSAICTCGKKGDWSVVASKEPAAVPCSIILEELKRAGGYNAPATPLSLMAGVVCPSMPEPVTKIVCRPIVPPGASEAAGMFVYGLSPRLRWDTDYDSYLDMCALNLATVIADAEAFAVERKRAETLAEIDRAKTAFFSNVSHEFRTPLTLMLGPLEDTLADMSEAKENSKQRANLTTVHRNALRLLRLVNSLLDFSRIEAGRATAFFQPTQLVPFTRDLVSSFRSATEKAGLDLVIDAHELPQLVYVDRDMWENIILNLMSNAFKFTLTGSIRVEIRVTRDGQGVAVTVRDTGVGIAEHELPRLFERFHRIEGAAGRSIEGSGIGLALVQELVLLHGAEMIVESQVGHGTAFTITLPFGTAHLPADRVSSKSEPATLGHRYSGFVAEALRWLPANVMKDEPSYSGSEEPRDIQSPIEQRILVVDDNADMRDYLRHLLESQGYQVDLAHDGLAAFEMVERTAPHLVLSDLMMPRLDGFGLLSSLRNNEATKDLPFIALSARAGEASKVEGLKAGVDDYLVKPFSSRELFARVDSALKLARVRGEARDALKEEYRRLRRLFEQAPGFIATTSGPDHVFEFTNASYQRLVGEREVLGKTVESALPEIKSQGFIELLDAVYHTGKPFVGENVELRLQQSPEMPPQDIVVNFVYEAITDIDGSVLGIFIEGHDVTAQHKANQHLQLLVNELNHRVKNVLAIIQSISQQTFRGERDAPTEKRAFEGRLMALAAAHDLLTKENWETPTLESVAREVVRVHALDGTISISGPSVLLSSKTAVTLTMALHELCTNAVKYGALSVPEGSITLCWDVHPETESRLFLSWREYGGPKVSMPARRGFGSSLIERALASELRGTVRLNFNSDGLVCAIEAPLPAVEGG